MILFGACLNQEVENKKIVDVIQAIHKNKR